MSKLSDNKRLLRLHVAVNFLKQQLLDDGMHLAGKPQTTAVFDKLSMPALQPTITGNTWRSWFNDVPKAVKVSKVEILDVLVADKFNPRLQDGTVVGKVPVDFFKELIFGGMVSNMLLPTDSKQVRPLLMVRAQKYTPISSLHLHLDAIEVNALVDDVFEVPWYVVTRLAADRILDVLHNRWGPRYGQIFSTFSSSLKLQWEVADATERKKIRESYARLKPDLFDKKIHAGANPNWNRIGVESDVAPQHIYKTLFAMAADPDFLVADRLTAWMFDLATAALAMHALAWSDCYMNFGNRATNELLFWRAFHHIFFDKEAKEIDERYLRPVMDLCNAEWDERSLSVFGEARKIYQTELARYGASIKDIMDIAELAEKTHPLAYGG